MPWARTTRRPRAVWGHTGVGRSGAWLEMDPAQMEEEIIPSYCTWGRESRGAGGPGKLG